MLHMRKWGRGLGSSMFLVKNLSLKKKGIILRTLQNKACPRPQVAVGYE